VAQRVIEQIRERKGDGCRRRGAQDALRQLTTGRRRPAPFSREVATALWRVLRGFGLVLAAIVIFVEEWGWRPLTAFAALLARWLHLQRLEARISASPPIVALLLFLAPAVLLFPLKLLALW
jgi:hypothetical protein